MNIIFQHVNTRRNGLVERLISNRLEKIGKRYPWIIQTEIFLRKERAAPVNKKICEIRMSVPGPVLFSSARSSKFEGAAIEAIGDIEVQLHKKKDALAAY